MSIDNITYMHTSYHVVSIFHWIITLMKPPMHKIKTCKNQSCINLTKQTERNHENNLHLDFVDKILYSQKMAIQYIVVLLHVLVS